MWRRLGVVAALALAVTAMAPVPADAAGSRLVRIARGLNQPIYVAASPGDPNRLYVVLKGGVIRVMRNGHLQRRPVLDISGRVSRGGEQGLLSMAFDRRSDGRRRVFVSYTNRGGNSRVVSYLLFPGSRERLNPATRRVWLKVHQPFSNHNGGHIAFGPSGRKLFVGMGDGGGDGDPGRRAQSSRSKLGKMLRINVHGNGRVSKFAKGLRNPWRFSFDRRTGDLWIGDVGQSRREEVDVVRSGRGAGNNFGWSYYEGTLVYKRQPIYRGNLRWPVAQYAHTRGNCSIIGGYVYRGGAAPRLRGHYIYADLCSGRVWKRPAGGGRSSPTGFSRKVSSIVSFGEGANGALFVVSLTGSIYRVVARP